MPVDDRGIGSGLGVSMSVGEKACPSGPNPGRSRDEVADGAAGPDRRVAVRYNPDPYVPVLFAHPTAETPTAGLIVDVSNGGARIIAPPTARPMLHWSDPLTIVVSYSDTVRESGIEGMRLNGHVVRLAVDSAGYVMQVRFDRANGNWTALEAWINSMADTTLGGVSRNSAPSTGL